MSLVPVINTMTVTAVTVYTMVVTVVPMDTRAGGYHGDYLWNAMAARRVGLDV